MAVDVVRGFSKMTLQLRYAVLCNETQRLRVQAREPAQADKKRLQEFPVTYAWHSISCAVCASFWLVGTCDHMMAYGRPIVCSMDPPLYVVRQRGGYLWWDPFWVHFGQRGGVQKVVWDQFPGWSSDVC